MQSVLLFICALLVAQQAFAFVSAPFKARSGMTSFKMAAVDKPKPEVIGKGDLLTKLQAATSFKKKDLETVVNSLIEVIREDVLTNGSELRLRDFGTFRQKVVAPRTGRNPKTGTPIKIGRSTTITFSPSDTGFRVRDE